MCVVFVCFNVYFKAYFGHNSQSGHHSPDTVRIDRLLLLLLLLLVVVVVVAAATDDDDDDEDDNNDFCVRYQAILTAE